LIKATRLAQLHSRSFAVTLASVSGKGVVLESPRAGTGSQKPLYLDNQATTAVDPRVVDAMLPFMTNRFGNPHSKSHLHGWETEEAVEDARGHIAAAIGAEAREVIFTSGATESNNLVLKGLAAFYGDKKKHIITTEIDHKCSLVVCEELKQQGFDITVLPVKTSGLICLD